jgi:hypothetical protein
MAKKLKIIEVQVARGVDMENPEGQTNYWVQFASAYEGKSAIFVFWRTTEFNKLEASDVKAVYDLLKADNPDTDPGQKTSGSILKQAPGTRGQAASLSIMKRLSRTQNVKDIEYAQSTISAAGGLVDIVYTTDKFILQMKAETQSEKYQIIENNKDEADIIFYGRRHQIYTFVGILTGFTRNSWLEEFKGVYENYLRGSKCIEKNLIVAMTYKNTVLLGYILNCQLTESANTENAVSFSFAFYVEDSIPIKMPPDIEKLIGKEGAEVTQEDTVATDVTISESLLLSNISEMNTVDNVNYENDIYAAFGGLKNVGSEYTNKFTSSKYSAGVTLSGDDVLFTDNELYSWYFRLPSGDSSTYHKIIKYDAGIGYWPYYDIDPADPIAISVDTILRKTPTVTGTNRDAYIVAYVTSDMFSGTAASYFGGGGSDSEIMHPYPEASSYDMRDYFAKQDTYLYVDDIVGTTGGCYLKVLIEPVTMMGDDGNIIEAANPEAIYSNVATSLGAFISGDKNELYVRTELDVKTYYKVVRVGTQMEDGSNYLLLYVNESEAVMKNPPSKPFYIGYNSIYVLANKYERDDAVYSASDTAASSVLDATKYAYYVEGPSKITDYNAFIFSSMGTNFKEFTAQIVNAQIAEYADNISGAGYVPEIVFDTEDTYVVKKDGSIDKSTAAEVIDVDKPANTVKLEIVGTATTTGAHFLPYRNYKANVGIRASTTKGILDSTLESKISDYVKEKIQSTQPEEIGVVKLSDISNTGLDYKAEELDGGQGD